MKETPDYKSNQHGTATRRDFGFTSTLATLPRRHLVLMAGDLQWSSRSLPFLVTCARHPKAHPLSESASELNSGLNEGWSQFWTACTKIGHSRRCRTQLENKAPRHLIDPYLRGNVLLYFHYDIYCLLALHEASGYARPALTPRPFPPPLEPHPNLASEVKL